MDLRIIIPVKPFSEAKQRLAPVLNPVQRAKLAEHMFRHVFEVAASCIGPANVIVVSRSEDILALARNEGGLDVLENNLSDLNSALSQGVLAAGVSRVLVVASDLPVLGYDDLVELAHSDCAIAPDRHQRGTNALLWPAGLLFAFGENSLARHRAIAENAGIAPTILVRRGLAYDVDVPDDLRNVEF